MALRHGRQNSGPCRVNRQGARNGDESCPCVSEALHTPSIALERVGWLMYKTGWIVREDKLLNSIRKDIK